MKTRIKKYSISKLSYDTLLLILFEFFVFGVISSYAQTTSPLSEKAKLQIEKNMVGSGDWHRLNELKMLNTNFPSASYQQQIEKIYEAYSFTLIGSEFEQEKRAWEVQQKNRQIIALPTPEQSSKDPFYYDKQTLTQQHKKHELYQLINSEKNNTIAKTSEKNNPLFWLADTNAVTFKEYAKYYYSAYNEIVNMLSGKSELNLKRTVFIIENAFYQNKLDYKKYCAQINELVLNCKKIISENKLNTNNFMTFHYAIQTLFREKLNYDFDDYMGDNDYSKMFVIKLLNTKKGQCHSLPLLYLILAEEFKISAYLGLAPNHSYIKFGNQYQSYNFETTNGSFVSDQWLVASGYISATAIKNGIYLKPLSKTEVVAECLTDLASGLEYLAGKSNFTLLCADRTLAYFPQSISALLVTNNFLVGKCANTAKRYKFPLETDYYKFPELKHQFDEMVDFENYIEQTGYVKIPPEQYELWQQTIYDAQQKTENELFINKMKQNIAK